MNNLLQSRFECSLLALICCLPISTFASVFLCLITSQIWHPFSSAFDAIVIMLHYSSWLYFIFICTVGVSAAYFHYTHYTITPTVFANRLAKISKICSPRSIGVIVAHGFCASVISLTLLSMIGSHEKVPDNYIHLTSKVENKLKVNVHHVFIILHSFFAGGKLAIDYLLKNKGMIPTPFVNQLKVITLKQKWQSLIHESFWNVMRHLHIFYILFYLSASSLHKSFESILNIETNENDHFCSIATLFDVYLLFLTVITGMFVQVLWLLAVQTVNVFLTEPVSFTIQLTFLKEDSGKVLQDIISSKDDSLMRNLAFQDLNRIARNDVEKRKQIFSLSQPGGHPIIWNSIAASCLNVLANAERELSVAPSGVTNGTDSYVSKTGLMQIASIFKNILSYFTHKFARHNIHESLAKCQPCIHIINALSHLVVKSYSEDQYGIVQQHLTAIMSSFINLHQALEVQQKNGVFSRKKNDGYEREIKISLQFKHAVSCAIWRITAVFKSDIMTVIRDFEHKRIIQTFLDLQTN